MRENISIRCSSTAAFAFLLPQSLKLLRTSEFLPYVVFLQSPEFEVLKAMNTSAVEAGVVAKTLTVSDRRGRLSRGPTSAEVAKAFSKSVDTCVRKSIQKKVLFRLCFFLLSTETAAKL